MVLLQTECINSQNHTKWNDGYYHCASAITPSLTWRYFDDTRPFICCRYCSPPQRVHICSNSCSSTSAPCFVVRPVSCRLISHILMSSIPAQYTAAYSDQLLAWTMTINSFEKFRLKVVWWWIQWHLQNLRDISQLQSEQKIMQYKSK